MIWFRAAIVVAVVGLVLVALSQTSIVPRRPPPATATASVAPTLAPTRIPLPTLAPEAIVSRISRETPAAPAASTPSTHPQVAVVDYGYSPQTLTIRAGTRVTWTNGGSDGHDVTGTGPGGDWRSGPLAPSERYTRVFDLPGTYAYVCTMHPEMQGRIIVQS